MMMMTKGDEMMGRSNRIQKTTKEFNKDWQGYF